MLKNYRYILKGLDCANCAREIEERLQQEKDLEQVVVNFSTLQLSFQTNRDDGVYSYIKNIVKEVEPEVEVLEKKEDIHQEKGLMLSMIRLGVGIFFIIVGCYVSLPFYLGDIFILIAYVVLLFPTAKNAFQMLKRSHTIHENFLITLSCVGAYLVGEKLEGFMVIILYEIGKILEEKAVHHSRKSIADLMNIKPETAWLEDGQEVLPENVKVGDIILVKPGEKVPLDGIIVDGSSHLNTSSLTGESKLLFVQSGMEVLSGSINQDGILKMKVTKDYQNSTVSKILELVENATDQKAKTETYVQHFSKIYTPIVIILAIMVGLLLPLFTSVSYQESIYRALTFLVISCPCAIAISVPLSYFSGIGRASREGILIKGSNYLDALRHITTIIFDKTGTLTTGEFVVTKVEVFDKNYTKEDVLKYAVLGESFSNHPIAKSILAYYPKEFNTTQVEDYQEIAGKGLSYQLKKKNIKIGNKDYVNFKKKVDLGTNVFVSVDEVVIGRLVLNDCLKSGTREAILRLKNKGIEVKMFTGDARETALSIGKELQIEDVKYELLPTDKYQEFVLVMETHPQGKVAFVGDGINDSPVLARADIGISMGGVGSSAAIEASDMVIMTDAIEKIEQAIFISQKTNRIIRENLIFALFTKGIVLLFSVIGIGGMWQAIFADVGVTLITIFNTLRILKDEK